MRTGKLPEHTFKRSVMNPIRYRLPDISFRAAVGHDGAVFGDMVTSMATTAFCYTGNELYALDNGINNIIAAVTKDYGKYCRKGTGISGRNSGRAYGIGSVCGKSYDYGYSIWKEDMGKQA